MKVVVSNVCDQVLLVRDKRMDMAGRGNGSNMSIFETSKRSVPSSFSFDVKALTTESHDVPRHREVCFVWYGGRRGRRACLPVLMPNAKLRLLWTCVGLVAMVYETFAVPAQLAWDLKTEDHPLIFSLSSAINLYFILDIIVQFLTAYESKGSSDIVLQHREIARHYIRRWFILDVAVAIPWEWLHAQARLARGAKVVRFIRALRLSRLLGLFKVFGNVDHFRIVVERFPSWAKAGRVFVAIVALFSSMHWGACVWYAIGAGAQGTTWLTENSLDDSSATQSYAWSLYFTMTTMTTVGYGDIHPVNNLEVRFALLLLPITTVIFATMMGFITDLVANLNQHSRKSTEKRLMLSRYMYWRVAPWDLMIRIRKHMVMHWDTKQHMEDYEKDLKTELPPTLRADLSFHIYGKVLQKQPYLAWMFKYPICLKELATLVQETSLERGDYLFRVGQRHEKIHILLSGWVSLSLCPKLHDNEAQSAKEGGASSRRRIEFLAAAARIPGAQHVGRLMAPAKTNRKRSNSMDFAVVRQNVGIVQEFAQALGMAVGKAESKHRGEHRAAQRRKSARCSVRTSLGEITQRPSQQGLLHAEILEAASMTINMYDSKRVKAAKTIQCWWHGMYYNLCAPGSRRFSSATRGEDGGARGVERTFRSPNGRQIFWLPKRDVVAPAYLGESCLWSPLEDWRTSWPTYGYAAKCEKHSDLIIIGRESIREVVERFSPILPRRFEVFRSAVVAYGDAGSFDEDAEEGSEAACGSSESGGSTANNCSGDAGLTPDLSV